MTETQLKVAVKAMIKKEFNFHGWKISDKFTSGIPDLIGCLKCDKGHGHFVALELKTLIGRVSRLQLYEIDQILKAGGRAGIAKSLEEAREFFKEASVCKNVT